MISNLSKFSYSLIFLFLLGCSTAKRETNASSPEVSKKKQSFGFENVLLSIQNFQINSTSYETHCRIELDEAIGNILPINQFETESFKAKFKIQILDSDNKELESRGLTIEMMEGELNLEVFLDNISENSKRCILTFDSLAL